MIVKDKANKKKVLPVVPGLGWCATLDLRLKDSALLSWSEKSDDSCSLTFPPVAEEEEGATERKQCFLALAAAEPLINNNFTLHMIYLKTLDALKQRYSTSEAH